MPSFCCRCSFVLLRPAAPPPPPRLLLLSLSLSFFGCAVSLTSLALPSWQLLDLPELSAVHEHSILYDCVRSEVTPLDHLSARDATVRGPTRRCAFKTDRKLFIGSSHLLRIAAEDDDLRARELLSHRFLPHHKAMLFFSAFTLLFALFSFAVGIFSICFWPNSVLHLALIGLATSCSLLADALFFIGANRDEIRRVPGPFGTHQQHLSYAFFVHVFASALLVFASVCSAIAYYLPMTKMKRRQNDNGQKEETVAEGKRLNNGAAVLLRNGLFLSAASLPFPSDSPNSSLSDYFPPPPPTPRLFQPDWMSQYLTGRKGTVGAESMVARRERDGWWSAV
ncbi:hypothetical protein niasHS_011103 [Heterodera schachtii]|uniref:Uncharacterized protein n=1 Tax=Heterodera schachtii TaxID=97005 RepID=A0ABD2IVF2_HETSC